MFAKSMGRLPSLDPGMENATINYTKIPCNTTVKILDVILDQLIRKELPIPAS